MKENIAERFDRYYCSEYTRAMETAALLDMKGAKWFVGALIMTALETYVYIYK